MISLIKSYKKGVFFIVFGLISGLVGYILGSINTFEAKSVLGSLWQYYQNGTTEVIYVTGVRVGIGTNTPKATLDVNGAIRVGDTNEVCNSKLEGVIRYHNGTFQVCDGESWK